MVAIATTMRPWIWPTVLLVIAALVRLPHYDVAWFGLDQIKFMLQARRVLQGDFNVLGPDASGLDIIGPLYSYLMAGVLWFRDDPRLLVLFGVVCDIGAAWCVYLLGNRLAGRGPAVVAALTYITFPTLVLGTRLLWNPTLLPLVVALAWWLALRYVERPSIATLAGVAFLAGLTLPLHATGVFHILGLMVAIGVARFPSWRGLLAAVVAGALPLLPVLPRVLGADSHTSQLSARIAMPPDVLPTFAALAEITLSFAKAFGVGWSSDLATTMLHVQAVVALIGVVMSLVRGGPYWAIWLGLAVSVSVEMAAALFYAAATSWHYFIALVPAFCLWIARALAALPRWRLAAATAMSAVAASHLFFMFDVDNRAIASGMIRVETKYLGVRAPELIGYSPTLRELRELGIAAGKMMPDGTTAMQNVHGARGELWRETGAEYVPGGGTPSDPPVEFVVMGPKASRVEGNGALIDERLCVFEPKPVVWRYRHGPQPRGWEQPLFDDRDWSAIELPRRVAAPSLGGPVYALASWQTPFVVLRGRFAANVNGRRLFGVVVRSPGYSAHHLVGAFVNGVPIAGVKDRVFQSSVSLVHEWLVDATAQTRPGDNTIALVMDGQNAAFDLDVFEVPCADAEWYH